MGGIDLSSITASVRETTVGAPTAADRAAGRNRSHNLRALRQSQPSLPDLLNEPITDLCWVYGRDGALTALDAAGGWYGNCSLPRRSAEAMLRSLRQDGVTGCFLSPAHAAQIEVALSMLSPRQAIIAVVPDIRDLAIFLHCCDFSRDIDAHRLWLAAGPGWADQLRDIFAANPGLPAPRQFIRTVLLHEQDAAVLIGKAQQVFGEVAGQRAQAMARLCHIPRPPHDRPRVCVVAPSHFELWNDAADVLATVLADSDRIECNRLDPDDPAAASGLALAMAVSESDAIAVANAGRADLPVTIAADRSVISWLTVPRIPASPQCAADALLLADADWMSLAQAAGWPAQRLAVAGWPTVIAAGALPNEPAHLALIADTHDPSPDRQTFDLSSHRLLWEMIHAELSRDPFILGTDIAGYLRGRMRQLNISDAGMDAARFVDGLIVPVWQQALARRLLSAEIPLRLFGAGWAELPEFAAHAAGPIQSRTGLLAAASAAQGLVYAWPWRHAHPIAALGRPVLVCADCGATALIQTARAILAGRAVAPTAPTVPAAVISVESILEAIRPL